MSTVLPILTKGLTKTFARNTFLLVFFGSIKSKVANIRAYLLAEQNKRQEEIINDLKRRLALKDRIISIISHDIRSPLDSLKALLELLNDRKVAQEEFQNITSNLNHQVGQLSQFLENLLKWIKNLTSEVNPHFEQLKLSQLIDESLALYNLQAERKGITIQSRISKDIIIFADREMVKLILRNLINNAVKFCHAGDFIYVEADDNHGEVLISVKDTGQGIPVENITKLFHVSQLSTVGTKNEIGTGLGLTLCKEFIEKMGGTIKATSVNGDGSKFEFTLHSPSFPSYEFQKFIEKHN